LKLKLQSGTKMIKVVIAISIFLLEFSTTHASDLSHSHVSKYTGQESQIIKSLSPDDIAELKRGAGWGLAKAAELNGIPGPTHLLEMKDEIPLTELQIEKIIRIYEGMRAQAIEQGERLITLELELENLFQDRTINDVTLRSSLKAIADARMELRYIHLATHLQTPEILSADQINKYNALRGYSFGAIAASDLVSDQ
jgi:Spy/CpxP family protein refolding chaperone